MSFCRRRMRRDDDSFSSDSDDGACCDSRKKKLYSQRGGFQGTIISCADRMKCGLPCLTPRNCTYFTFYILCTLLAIAFLYYYGITALIYLWKFGRFIIRAVLPASWLKSTKDIVNEALAKYSADRLGLPDYALESAGGSVLCSSDTYFSKTGPLYSVFGVPLWYHASTPREVIQPDVQPGKCWAMDGTQGYVMIQLAMPIVVSAISLEHIPKEVAPLGRLDSAPKEFLVIGKEKDLDSPDVILGKFAYEAGKDPIQYFEIKDPYCTLKESAGDSCGPNRNVFNVINLKILSNHGNPEYTCIYRMRVHGHPLQHYH